MDLTSRVEAVQRTLERLRDTQRRYDRPVYRLRAPRSDAEVRAFERRFAITIPEPYRTFIQTVGDGDDGWVLDPLSQTINGALLERRPHYLQEPFPIDESLGRRVLQFHDSGLVGASPYEEVNHRLETYREGETPGCLRLVYTGSGRDSIGLVVQGPMRGSIWLVDETYAPVLRRPYAPDGPLLDFLDWYELWLDQQLQPGFYESDPARFVMAPETLTYLDLSCAAVQELPDVLFDCESLRVLRLRECDSLRRLPPQLGRLRALTTLELTGASSLEMLPESLGQLEALETLRLRGTLRALPESLGQLGRLTSLEIHGLSLESLPETIGLLGRLRRLLCSSNRLTRLPESLGDLTALERLDLSWNQLRSLPPGVDRLLHLESLRLFPNPWADPGAVLTQVGRLPRLRSLRIGDPACITDELGYLRALESLSLDGTGAGAAGIVVPEGIGHLTDLKHLNLRGCSAVPETIRRLASLKTLRLTDSTLTSLPAGIGGLESLEVLTLDGCGLRELPPEIGGLRQLRELDLANNELRTLPLTMEGLHHLQTLDLRNNPSLDLSVAFEAIGALEGIDTLRLDTEHIPDQVDRLVHLEDLELEPTDGHRLSISAHLGRLDRLRSLSIAGECADLPPSLRDLESLLYLELHATGAMSPPAWLGELPHLETLLLTDLAWTRLPDSLAGASRLVELDLSGSDALHPSELFSLLGRLPTLERLVSSVAVLPAEIGTLTGLRSLTVELPDDSPEELQIADELGALKSLQRLDLDQTGLRSIPDTVVELRALRELSLDGNQIERLPDDLGELRQLRELSLDGNRLRQLPSSIGRLASLEMLSASNNALEDLPASLGELEALSYAALDHNRLTQLPAGIGHLARLERLDLEGNQLTSLPPQIQGLARLRMLDLSHNRLETLPPQLGHLRQLRDLYLVGNPIAPEQHDAIRRMLPSVSVRFDRAQPPLTARERAHRLLWDGLHWTMI